MDVAYRIFTHAQITLATNDTHLTPKSKGKFSTENLQTSTLRDEEVDELPHRICLSKFIAKYIDRFLD